MFLVWVTRRTDQGQKVSGRRVSIAVKANLVQTFIPKYRIRSKFFQTPSITHESHILDDVEATNDFMIYNIYMYK